MPTPDDEQGRVEYRIAVRFGDDLLQAGFTAVPNLLLNHYSDLGLSSAEFLFIIHLCQYWWTEKNPYPSLQAIADKMGTSQRQTRRYAESLKAAQLLEVHDRTAPGRGQITSEYDLSKLFARLLELAPSSPPVNGDMPTPRTELTGGGRSKMSGAPRTPVSAEEYEGKSDKVSSNTTQPLSESPGVTHSKFRKGISPDLDKGELATENQRPPTSPADQRLAPTVEVSPESTKKHVPTALPVPVQATSTDRMDRIYEALREAGIEVQRAAVEEPPVWQPGLTDRQTSAGEEDADSEYIDVIIRDISAELHDDSHTRSNVTQARRLWETSGMTVLDFKDTLYDVRRVVRLQPGVNNRGAYYFKCLKVVLGVERNPNPNPPKRRTSASKSEATATDPTDRKSLAGKFAHLVQH